MRNFLLFVLAFFALTPIFSQGYFFGVKGGLTIGTQKWNTFQRDPLLKPHGILFIEGAPEGNEFALFAQAGYHQKGSALRNRNFFDPQTSGFFRPPAFEFVFQNVSLVLGGKQKLDFTGNSKAYYLFGLRGDYTIDTNLDTFNEINERNPVFPLDSDAYIQRLNYGVTVGAGIEVPFTELIGMLFEFSVNPDFSYQYRQPEIRNIIVRDPYNGNSLTSIPERRIRNLTFEATIGFRFLRKIEYID
jgi:hypothetical protein